MQSNFLMTNYYFKLYTHIVRIEEDIYFVSGRVI